MNKPTYIDLFAGCGGLSLGLNQAGWKGLFAVEKSADAFNTLQFNLIEKLNHFDWVDWLPVKNWDINEVLNVYSSQLKSLRGSVDMVVGGPPCQGFSSAGRRVESDHRNGLINSYLEFVEVVQPKFIFFENVKGFTLRFGKNRSKGVAYANYVTDRLRGMGYEVSGEMVDFSNFGIPQKRTRFILVGIRTDISASNKISPDDFFNLLSFNSSSFLDAKGLSNKVSLQDAISDLLKSNGTVSTPDRPNFQTGKYTSAKSAYQCLMRSTQAGTLPNSHSFANHRPEVSGRFSMILEKCVRNKNVGKKALFEDFKTSKHTIVPLSPTHPSPTLTTLPDDFIHYAEPRILTVREYARIQSFPDWFEFKGKYTTGGKERVKQVPRYTQVGNAIPPLFGEQSGLALKLLLQNG